MSAREQFAEELRRMGRQNGAYLDANRLVPLIDGEIDSGAECINVFHSLINKREYLLVTSASTRFIDSGLFSMKVRWMVPHEDIVEVSHSRRLQMRYVRDVVVLETRDRTYEFTIGFGEASGMAQMLAIAENNAEVAVGEIRGAMRALSQPAADPDLEAFHRSIALAESGPTPDTEPSDDWVDTDYARLIAWLDDAYKNGRRKAVWDRRIALGYQLGQGPATKAQWFWINALPALAGLGIGMKGHPLLATFAGYADQAVDRSDPNEANVMEQIETEFFG